MSKSRIFECGDHCAYLKGCIIWNRPSLLGTSAVITISFNGKYWLVPIQRSDEVTKVSRHRAWVDTSSVMNERCSSSVETCTPRLCERPSSLAGMQWPQLDENVRSHTISHLSSLFCYSTGSAAFMHIANLWPSVRLFDVSCNLDDTSTESYTCMRSFCPTNTGGCFYSDYCVKLSVVSLLGDHSTPRRCLFDCLYLCRDAEDTRIIMSS